MEAELKKLLQILQKLLGYHRELLECLRKEHQALVDAAMPDIQEMTYAKEILLATLGQVEHERLASLEVLSRICGKKLETFSDVVLATQGAHPQLAESVRNTSQALRLVLERMSKLNAENGSLVAQALVHVQRMKTQVLGEAGKKSETYTGQGHPTAPPRDGRLVSAEV